MERKIYSSGTKWEEICGYSRAVRVGNIIEIAGTVAVNEKNEIIGTDFYTQTKFILDKIGKALEEAGASLSDVTRTRMFTTDITQFEQVSKAHGEVFKQIRPVCTLVEVSRLVQPELLIEIEASAIISS